ncbi:hypothetical protein HK100_006768 [Physocladia obscura]|uniref:Uncharacterized protein n=1 Tax=Physocladia obscura TaxID=109957 RepID=A0AAD5SVQ2_9FUNG|nr:hypothetical protein HK100_006768 [Physocladia obscura]
MPPSAAASVSSGWSLIQDDAQIRRKQQTSTTTQYPPTTNVTTATTTTATNAVPMVSIATGITPIPATSSKDRLVLSTCIYRFLADCTASGFPISYNPASIMTPKCDSAFDYIYRIVQATVAPPATLLLSLILADKILLKMKLRDDAMLKGFFFESNDPVSQKSLAIWSVAMILADAAMNDNAFAASSWAQVTVFKEARVVAAWKRWVGDLMNWDFEVNEVEWCESFLTTNPVIRLLCAQNQFINAQIMSLKDQQRQRTFEISAELSRIQLPAACTIEWHEQQLQQQKLLEQQQQQHQQLLQQQQQQELLPQYPTPPFSPQSFVQPRVSSLQTRRSLPAITPTQQQQYYQYLQAQQQQQQQQYASRFVTSDLRGLFGSQPAQLSQPQQQPLSSRSSLPRIPGSIHYDDNGSPTTSSSRISTLFDSGASSVGPGSSASTNSRVSSVIASVVAYRKSLIDIDDSDSATVSSKYSSNTGRGAGRGWLSATEGFGGFQTIQQQTYTGNTYPRNITSQTHRTHQQPYQSQQFENAQQQHNFPQKQWTSETSYDNNNNMELSTSLSNMQLSGTTTPTKNCYTRTSSLSSTSAAAASASVAATAAFLGTSPATAAVILAQKNSFSAAAGAGGSKVQVGSWGARSGSGNSVGNVAQLSQQQQQVWNNVGSKQQHQQPLCRCVKASQSCTGCVNMVLTGHAYAKQEQQSARQLQCRCNKSLETCAECVDVAYARQHQPSLMAGNTTGKIGGWVSGRIWGAGL